MKLRFDLADLKQALRFTNSRSGGVMQRSKPQTEGNRIKAVAPKYDRLPTVSMTSGYLLFSISAQGEIELLDIGAPELRDDGLSSGRYRAFAASDGGQEILQRACFFVELIQPGGRERYEFPISMSDGMIRHLQFDCMREEKSGGVAEVRVDFSDVTALRVAENALSQSENRFQMIVEAIDEVFWMSDASMEQIRYISPAYESLWGRSAQSLYENPHSFIEAIHPDDLARVLPDLYKPRNGKAFSHEYRIIRPDGMIRWVLDRGFPVKGKSGKLTGYAGVVRDITERKLYEQALQLNQRVLDLAQDGFWITDANGYLKEANRAYAEISGYAREELVGMHISQLDILEDNLAVAEHIDILISRGFERFETRHRHKDGHEIDIEVSAVYFRESSQIAAFLRDITERKQAELILNRQKDLLYQIIDTDPDLVHVKDMAGRFLVVNRAAAAVYGRSPEDLVGHTVPQHIHSGEYLAADSKSSLEVIETQGKIETVVRDYRNGAERWLSVTKLPMPQPDGTLRVLCIERDFTEQRIAERQLQALAGHLQSAREEEKASVAREIHDDLGSTLAALKMEINLLAEEDGIAGNDEVRRRIEAVTQLIDYAMDSTRRIIKELRPAILDDFGLRAAFDWQAGLFRQRTGIECNIVCAPCGGCDKSVRQEWNIHLFRIFQEALANVSRHSGASKVKVAMRCGDGVSMSIRDNGCGLPQDGVVSPDSFGMRGMAERVAFLGGKIRFDSLPGSGLEIAVELLPPRNWNSGN